MPRFLRRTRPARALLVAGAAGLALGGPAVLAALPGVAAAASSEPGVAVATVGAAGILPAGEALRAVGAQAAPPAGPQVTTPDRCWIYWPGRGSQSIPITLSGFAAGQALRVELKVRGVTVSGLPSVTTDPAGGAQATIANWTSGLGTEPSRARTATLVVSDIASGTAIASTETRVANAGLEIDTSRRRYDADRRWIVSGLSRLTGGRSYYAFYFRGGRQVGHQRLGPAGECGYLRTRALLIPFQQVGTYQLRVQASSKFRRSRAWAGGTITQRAADRPRPERRSG